MLAKKHEEHPMKAVASSQAGFIERNKENVDATTVVFRTAYECAQFQLSFTGHERLISINGLKCSEMPYSHSACSNIVAHIANCMC
jgi:hypothetical protein